MRAQAGLLPSWIPSGRALAGLCVLGAAAGLIITGFPVQAAILGIGVWTLALLLGLHRRISVLIPLVLLLSFPADHITGLDAAAHGFFVLGATALLCFTSVLRAPKRDVSPVDWDLFLLSGILTVTTLYHAHSGEVRGVLFWISACFFLYWLRAEERIRGQARSQI